MKSSDKRLKNGLKKEFVFGSLSYRYELFRQERKTLSLSVFPDFAIVVKCPASADSERVEAFLRRKWFWLEKQLRFFRKYQRRIIRKEYLSGESFLYLGKQYALAVRAGGADTISLLRGTLLVQTVKSVADGNHTRRLLDTWYQEKIEKVFCGRYEEMKRRFDYSLPPRLAVKEMKNRWGSFSARTHRITLNPKLICSPKECIEYVIVHELCHVRHRNHGKNFYALLDQKYPNWAKTKEKLETVGIQIF